jgi:hypothetical protein
MNSRDEGLGFSVLIYLAALLCGIAVFAVPLYLASRPTVIDNASVQTVDKTLAARADKTVFPVAHLKHETIVNPATLAAVNAEAEKAEQAHRPPIHTARRVYEPRREPIRRSFAEVAPEHRPNFFPSLFSLF